MQTFSVSPDHTYTARVLDWRRLNKQLTECKQIMLALSGSFSWSSHPAVKMWRGCEAELKRYALAMYNEWQRRWDDGERGGKRDHKAGEWFRELEVEETEKPAWMGDESFHSSHRAALLYKDEEWYGRFGWMEEPQGPVDGKWQYVWPAAA